MDEYRNDNQNPEDQPVPETQEPQNTQTYYQNGRRYYMNGQPYQTDDQPNIPQNQQAEQPYQQNVPQNQQPEQPYQQNWQPEQQNAPQNWQVEQPYQQAPNQNWQNNQQYQQNGSPYYQNNQPYQTPVKETNGKAVASMIVGIFAMLSCCIPFLQFPLAITAIVLVILSKKGKPFSGYAIAGLVLGIISIIISVGMILYVGAVITLFKNDPEFFQMYNEILQMYQ